MKRAFLILSILGMCKISSAQWSTSGSDVYYNSGNVGIGTTSPAASLHLGQSNQEIRLDYNGTNNYYGSLRWAGLQFGNNGINRIIAGRTASGGRLDFYVNNTNDAADYSLNPDGILAMTLNSNGNTGIGTTSPVGKLSISNSGANGLEINPVTGLNSGTDIISYNRSNSTYTPIQFAAKEYVLGTSNVSTAMFIAQNGNVGVGTSNPLTIGGGYTALDIRGAVNGATIEMGIGSGTGTRYGEIGATTNVTTFYNFNNSGTIIGNVGYTEFNAGGLAQMHITGSGNVGIGTTTPDSKLTVAGKIHSQEVKVAVNAGADFVFDDDYKLPSLTETESFIKTNKHLPEIASAEDMKKNGLELGEMNIKLLQKIEELTLHLIEKDKQITALQDRMKIVEGKIIQ